MGNKYSISFGRGTTLLGSTPGANTLLFINPKSDCGIEILRVWATQEDVNTSDQQPFQLVTQVTAFPTLTTFTPIRMDIGGPISQIIGGTAGAAGTCGINASAEGAGAKTILFQGAFNILSGFLWVPARERIILPRNAASGFGLYFPAAPATVANWSAGLVYEELN